MSQEKYKVIFIIGPPGSGKNTQCDKLVQTYNFIHLGAGDLLREEIKSGSEKGKFIDSIISKGNIVPVEITCGLLKDAMDKHGKDKCFLIDGYPRNMDNITGWLKVFGDSFSLLTTIILDCDEDTLVKRLLERGKTSGRKDDDAEVIKTRFKNHYSQSKPIEPELKKMGNIISVMANKSIDDVFGELVEKMNAIEEIKKYKK